MIILKDYLRLLLRRLVGLQPPRLRHPSLKRRGMKKYEDVAGYCKSATLADIKKNDYVLTPGRYVGVAEEEDDGIPFEEKMADLTATLKAQMTQAEQLDADIRENLKLLGYE